jgi:hypothetical protein
MATTSLSRITTVMSVLCATASVTPPTERLQGEESLRPDSIETGIDFAMPKFMRFEVAQRVVRDELGKSSPENEFTPQGFVEANTAFDALKHFLDREQAVVLGPIEKTRDAIVSSVRIDGTYYAIRIQPEK